MMVTIDDYRYWSQLRFKGYALPAGDYDKAVETREMVLAFVRRALDEGHIHSVGMENKDPLGVPSLFIRWERTEAGDEAVRARIRMAWVIEPDDWGNTLVDVGSEAEIEQRARECCGDAYHEVAAKTIIREKLRMAYSMGDAICSFSPEEFQLQMPRV